MDYRVIIIETDKMVLKELANDLKQTPSFTVLSTYDDVNAAIGQSSMYNPNLFLLDIDNPAALNALPAFVDIFPNSMILGMMSDWNVQSAYEALQGGAFGCILKSYKPAEIIDSINLYKRRGQAKPPRIITFFSPKGRSGRTTLASILALTVAKKSGETVSLIDADLQFGDLPMFFDVEPKHTVVDAVHDVKWLTPTSFDQYFYKLKENVWLLSSPDRPEYAELVDAERLVEVISMAGNMFRYLFIDLPAGFNPLSIALSRFANINFVMAMFNTGLELGHMKRSLELFQERSTRKKHNNYPIFTRVNPCDELKKAELEYQLGYHIEEIIPNEYNMISVANSGRIAKGLPEDTLLMKKIDTLAEKIITGKI